MLAVVDQTAQNRVELSAGLSLEQELDAEAALELCQGRGSGAEDLHCGRLAHGSSEARTIRAAIRNCRTFVKLGVNDAILARLTEIEKVMPRSSVVTKEPSDEGVRV